MPLTPNNRNEAWMKGMVDGSTTLTPNNRKEHWYQAIIDGSTDLEPNKRSEYWYKEIMESKGGGGSSNYVILEDNDTLGMTWQEISDALSAGKVIIINKEYVPLKVSKVTDEDEVYGVWVYFDTIGTENEDYIALSPNDYPFYD